MIFRALWWRNCRWLPIVSGGVLLISRSLLPSTFITQIFFFLTFPQLRNCCEFLLIDKSIFESDFNFSCLRCRFYIFPLFRRFSFSLCFWSANKVNICKDSQIIFAESDWRADSKKKKLKIRKCVWWEYEGRASWHWGKRGDPEVVKFIHLTYFPRYMLHAIDCSYEELFFSFVGFINELWDYKKRGGIFSRRIRKNL
jgi:hypothetical protein